MASTHHVDETYHYVKNLLIKKVRTSTDRVRERKEEKEVTIVGSGLEVAETGPNNTRIGLY